MVLLLPGPVLLRSRGAAWRVDSDRTIATVGRSWRKNWRDRRALRLLAGPACAPWPVSSHQGSDSGARGAHIQGQTARQLKKATTCLDLEMLWFLWLFFCRGFTEGVAYSQRRSPVQLAHPESSGPKTWDDSWCRRHRDSTSNWTESGKMPHFTTKNSTHRRLATI